MKPIDDCLLLTASSMSGLKMNERSQNRSLYLIASITMLFLFGWTIAFFDISKFITNLQKPEPRMPQISESAEYRIPMVCYQTWITKDLKMLSNTTKEIILQNRKLNPDIRFELWDDDDVNTFMKAEFSGRVYDAFTSINPKYGAARADFFRYCVLYRRGGLYLDIKSIMKVAHIFGWMIFPDDICILDEKNSRLEDYRQEWDYGVYEQWFLAFAPEHPYLENMIDRMVRRVESKFEPRPIGIHKSNKQKVLRLTGKN